MPSRLILVGIVAITAVIATIAITGRFHVTTVRERNGSYLMMVDRFTGAAYMCVADRCRSVPYDQTGR